MKRDVGTLAVAVLVMFCASAGAGQIDWTETYGGVVDQQQTNAVQASMGVLYSNLYGWDRAVSIWQEFTSGADGQLGGISLLLRSASQSGSFDLRIYDGRGVDGTLLGMTHFSWNQEAHQAEGFWYTFKLDEPVELASGSNYTFSVENLSANFALYMLGVSGNANPYNGSYMHQGYQMAGWPPYSDAMGSTNTSTSFDAPFKTVMVPEPASMVLLAVGGAGLLRRRRAGRA